MKTTAQSGLRKAAAELSEKKSDTRFVELDIGRERTVQDAAAKV